MSKIQVMSENLANKIAAGEVVERISSVVKELVENSIDAKSKCINIDLLDSGTKSIRVTDDGIGMDKEDAEMCFLRHATSKLLKEDDLFFINTLGFRGEALPSIASVSKVDLKTSQGSVGTHLVIHGGTQVTLEPYAARTGTIIEVSDLFYNTPARLKYLKSDTTELANVTLYIERLALSHPDISFSLTNNSKKIVFTSGSDDLLKTIHEIYGYSVSSNMIEINVSNDDYDIFGFISKPSILKSNRNQMTTIVNGRCVKNAEVNKAINDGYFTFKPDIKYPVVVLKIETDPTLIDVNIHPTKQDIKFSKIESLKELLTEAINESLKKALLIPKIEVKTSEPYYNEIVMPEVHEEEIPYSEIEQTSIDFREDKSFESAVKEVETSSDASLEQNELIKKLELYPAGVVFGTYIIAQNDDGMYLIDQHAAQERINYERVLHALASDKVFTTTLLIPITIELSSSEYLKIKENINILEELGFKVEEFGVNTYIVKEHPTWLRVGLETESTKKIFDIIIEGKHLFDRVKFQDHIAATMACKMSVKGNEAITLEQAEKLLEDLVLCDNPYNCPHGRPTIITFTKYELERMFKRVMN
ncbi:MAG: DNA mismatch repair endonuclease MutL [Erysipelotrichales bacterium]|nr:DNA mismatch repair endonuclease MutL [Erysipelotrichales bacterium]